MYFLCAVDEAVARQIEMGAFSCIEVVGSLRYIKRESDGTMIEKLSCFSFSRQVCIKPRLCFAPCIICGRRFMCHSDKLILIDRQHQ